MAAIQFDGVSKTYPDGTVAVESLDLDIREGELMVFVGPSGCGKTTALRMVAGLEEISGGEVRIGGRVVNDVSPKDRDIAMVFQNYALYPHMTVAQNLAFGLKLRHIDRSEVDRRVAEAAATLGLDGYLDRKPRALSGGQRQRVAMGRAIVREPQAFLMDEPLSNLDAKLRVQVRADISKLQRELGVTTIYVTHDQVEAMTMGDRIAVMCDGTLQQVDTPEQRLRAARQPVRRRLHRLARDEHGRRGADAPERRADRELRRAQPRARRAARAARLRRRDGRHRHPPRGLRGRCVRRRHARGSFADGDLHAARVARLGGARALHGRAARTSSPACSRRRRSAKATSAPLSVDTTRLHFFDPKTGTSI